MARASAHSEIPQLPENAVEWRRSLRRGSMFHGHVIGFPACGARLYLDRHKSEALKDIGHGNYWGFCPRCVAKGKKA